MKRPIKLLTPLAAGALAVAMTPSVAFADHANGSYSTTLDEINNSGASGMVSITVEGDQATVDLNWSGLAPTFSGGPYPHVQHIHIGARGECPTQAADDNGDGIVDTVEGQPSYGAIGTTLSTKGDTSPAAGTNIKTAPAGGSTDYSRTITLDEKTLDSLADGTGVIVVHGLNPADLSKEAANAKSNLVPELPLAATSPALCGALSSMPSGGVDTGSGSTSGIEDVALFGLGGGLLAAAGVAFGLRRRSGQQAG